eukprot:TRINITY_DN3615_c0_g3_i1.p1 TRINITY_DN3615_c0_g3~~TRINITY_DN3615_c0_g3_i1.p1  ORF type:complete len:267 (+),score=21.18 TRINITY_DN3615_c0_g3_i1:126-926(+)
MPKATLDSMFGRPHGSSRLPVLDAMYPGLAQDSAPTLQSEHNTRTEIFGASSDGVGISPALLVELYNSLAPYGMDSPTSSGCLTAEGEDCEDSRAATMVLSAGRENFPAPPSSAQDLLSSAQDLHPTIYTRQTFSLKGNDSIAEHGFSCQASTQGETGARSKRSRVAERKGPSRTSSGTSSPHSSSHSTMAQKVDPEDQVEASRRQSKLERNRLSAQKSRYRRRQQIVDLEAQVADLVQQNVKLQELVGRLMWENHRLRQDTGSEA